MHERLVLTICSKAGGHELLGGLFYYSLLALLAYLKLGRGSYF
jgi:hypothetical protein